jgi:hypothetical protein
MVISIQGGKEETDNGVSTKNEYDVINIFKRKRPRIYLLHFKIHNFSTLKCENLTPSSPSPSMSIKATILHRNNSLSSKEVANTSVTKSNINEAEDGRYVPLAEQAIRRKLGARPQFAVIFLTT